MREVMSYLELQAENERLKKDILDRDNTILELNKVIGELRKMMDVLVIRVNDLEESIINQGKNITELNIRNSNIEKHLGADESYCIWEDIDNEDKEILPTLPEQFSLLSQRIDDISLPVLKETVYVGGNTGKMRAIKGFEKLKSMPYKNGKQFITGPQMTKFLAFEIEDDYRTKDKNGKPVLNRQAAKDTINLIHEMFPEKTSLNPEQSRSGKKRPYNVISFLDKPEKL
jgi:uncharacterized coiled-coil protein SlyX